MPYFLIVLDYHISTNYEKLTKALNTFCVNALTRAYPISTDEGNPNPDDVIEVCQCPYSGLSHFYVEPEEPPVEPEELYQCPYLGLSHFYEALQTNEKLRRRVNALGRAYPISTVSLPKPFKINGFRVRFQGVIVRKF